VVSARSGRGGEEGSSPVGRSDDVKGTGIGPNRSCSPGPSDGDREGEMVIIVRSTKSDKGRSGALFEGVGGEIRPLESAGVVHDGVEGVRGGQGEVTVESGEDYIALIEKWGKAQLNVEKADGSLGDPEET
jgi:hypothetical protein